MTVSLKHTFVSAIPNVGDATLVEPSDWNAEHTLSMATGKMLGRTTAGTGAFEEITIGSGLSLSAGSLSATASGGTVTSVAALTLGTTGTDLSSTVATGTTTPVITLQVPTASATNRGALSAADWTTFNNKGSGTVTSVTGTAPVVSSGGATPAISMAAATGSVNGYLTSTDWTTFNSKQTALTLGTGVQTALAINVDTTGSFVSYGTNTGANARAITATAIANGADATAVGYAANSTGAQATTLGSGSLGNGIASTAIGYTANATGITATAIGAGSVASGTDATAIGETTRALGTTTVAIGGNVVANGNRACAVGGDANSTADFATSIGYFAKTTYANSTSIGAGALATAVNQVRIGTASETVSIPGALNVVGKTTPRMNSQASASTLTPNADTYDNYAFTALAAAITINADAGTPLDGQKIIIRFLDNATARAITWTTGSSKAFRAVGITLPTTTTISKTLYVGGIYNTNAARWDMIATGVEA